MKILIVSGKEYSVSNRGIDVITAFLARTNEVKHLYFYKRAECKEKIINKNLSQIYFVDNSNLYRDKYKYFMPSFILDYIFKKMLEKSNFDFSVYDLVILESGYPIFLTPMINKKLIYRQSDPTEIAFNTKRKYFKRKEEQLCKKADFISTALDFITFPESYKNKITVWRTGFLNTEIEKLEKENLIVYMGGTPIDYHALKCLASRYSNYKFVIIGNFKDKIRMSNVIFTGYQNFENYKNYIIKSKIFLMPIKPSYVKHMNNLGFTSKYYLPLSLGIPIVCKSHGIMKKNDIDKKIFVYNDLVSLFKIFDELLLTGKFQDFKVSTETETFLDRQTIEYKEKELNDFFNEKVLL